MATAVLVSWGNGFFASSSGACKYRPRVNPFKYFLTRHVFVSDLEKFLTENLPLVSG
jgi:hypothetical protein